VGALAARAGKALSKPISRTRLSADSRVRSGPDPSAPEIGQAPRGERVDVFGTFGPARYIRTASGLEGWL